MVKEKACIFISGTGTNLKFILKNSRDSNFPINIVLVISNNKKAFGISYAKNFQFLTKLSLIVEKNLKLLQ